MATPTFFISRDACARREILGVIFARWTDNGGQIEWWKRLMELFYGRIMGTRKGFRAFTAPIDKGVINLSINRFKMLSRYRRVIYSLIPPSSLIRRIVVAQLAV